MKAFCRPFSADLDLLAAGVLPTRRTSAVEAHLRGCGVCRDRYARALALCAELSTAGRAVEPPEAAVWRLRNGVRTAITAPRSGPGRRWQMATALAAGLACIILLAYGTTPTPHSLRPAESSSATPSAPDPPLTLLACEQAAARSDAAFDLILSRDAARAHTAPDEPSLRAFSPMTSVAFDHDYQLP